MLVQYILQNSSFKNAFTPNWKYMAGKKTHICLKCDCYCVFHFINQIMAYNSSHGNYNKVTQNGSYVFLLLRINFIFLSDLTTTSTYAYNIYR